LSPAQLPDTLCRYEFFQPSTGAALIDPDQVMQPSIAGHVSLPYKLKRPYFTFFTIFTFVCLLVLAGMALFGSREGLLPTLLIVGSLWLGLSMGVVFNWQFLTLYHDQLLFKHFWKKHQVLYKDIQGVEVVEMINATTGSILTLYLHHAGTTSPSPLKVNFKLFSVRDRAILLKTIKDSAPDALLNDGAEEILMLAG
jgi:hypothetical protein